MVAEYRFPLESEVRFDVRATSSVRKQEASGVDLMLVLELEDGGAPEPLSVTIETGAGRADFEVTPEEWPLELRADAELFPCDLPCIEDAVFTIRPAFAGPRDVYVGIALDARGTRSRFPAWEHLDLGVQGPPEAY